MIFSYVLLSFWLSWRVSAMESMKGCRAENISSDSEQFSWVSLTLFPPGVSFYLAYC